ncbi:hypothetical protein JZ751_022176 [Albula glossodonta]|uniref:Uncharacterized protein n=1 Tax=Albula glossodonta TaxID=121402 RepID=A0A8T2MU59_9TELE|nr:hypothetical protein JZ751_022176 [Albula glossodonta]
MSVKLDPGEAVSDGRAPCGFTFSQDPFHLNKPVKEQPPNTAGRVEYQHSLQTQQREWSTSTASKHSRGSGVPAQPPNTAGRVEYQHSLQTQQREWSTSTASKHSRGSGVPAQPPNTAEGVEYQHSLQTQQGEWSTSTASKHSRESGVPAQPPNTAGRVEYQHSLQTQQREWKSALVSVSLPMVVSHPALSLFQICGFLGAMSPGRYHQKHLLALRFSALNPILDPWVFILFRKAIFCHLRQVLHCCQNPAHKPPTYQSTCWAGAPPPPANRLKLRGTGLALGTRAEAEGDRASVRDQG